MRILLLIFCLLTYCQAVRADYEIRDYSFGNGYGISTGGIYTLYGSVDQVSPGSASGTGYALNTGWFTTAAGCIVNLHDLSAFAQSWLVSSSISGDLNKDGSVNARDFASFAAHWLTACPNDWMLK